MRVRSALTIALAGALEVTHADSKDGPRSVYIVEKKPHASEEFSSLFPTAKVVSRGIGIAD